MEQTLQHPDVFSATVLPLIREAKKTGATARSISDAFMTAMTSQYGDEADLKELAATVGFIQLLKAEGGSVSAKQAAKLYGGPNGCTEEAVRKAARQGQLIALRDGNGNLHFPVWQFSPRGGTLPGVREALEVLAGLPHTDDLFAATFFINPTSRLNDMSPLEALRVGGEKNIAAVLRLAAEAIE